MPFTDSELDLFVEALVRRGWRSKDGEVSSPSAYMNFNRLYFSKWEPQKVKEGFLVRAARTEKATYDLAAQATGENRDVAAAADDVLVARVARNETPA